MVGFISDNVVQVGRDTAQVVAMMPVAELRQAEYYKALLGEQRAHVEDEIRNCCVALAQTREQRKILRLRRQLLEKRREQFRLYCLHQALDRRFFPRTRSRSSHNICFDIDVSRYGSLWMIRIPEIDVLAKVSRREEAEMTAREHIAVSIGVPIADVAVQVVGES
jgi:hypothetical protein